MWGCDSEAGSRRQKEAAEGGHAGVQGHQPWPQRGCLVTGWNNPYSLRDSKQWFLNKNLCLLYLNRWTKPHIENIAYISQENSTFIRFKAKSCMIFNSYLDSCSSKWAWIWWHTLDFFPAQSYFLTKDPDGIVDIICAESKDFS